MRSGYWWLPLVSALIWWGMLVALLVTWICRERPHYPWMPERQDIPFISHIGATDLKPLFVLGTTLQGIFFVLSLASERYLRHAKRLSPNHRTREKVLAAISVGLAAVGQIGVICVAVFDSVNHEMIHYAMLVIFILFVGASTICTFVEYVYLDRYNPDCLHIKISTWLKLAWLVLELALVVTFVATNGYPNICAIFEWAVSFAFPFYTLCLVLDLAPAKTSRSQTPDLELEKNLTTKTNNTT